MRSFLSEKQVDKNQGLNKANENKCIQLINNNENKNLNQGTKKNSNKDFKIKLNFENGSQVLPDYFDNSDNESSKGSVSKKLKKQEDKLLEIKEDKIKAKSFKSSKSSRDQVKKQIQQPTSTIDLDSQSEKLETIRKNAIINIITDIIIEIILDNENHLISNSVSNPSSNGFDPTQSLFQEETLFHSELNQSITIKQYLERIVKFTQMESNTLILALIYLDRFCLNSNIFLTWVNIHK